MNKTEAEVSSSEEHITGMFKPDLSLSQLLMAPDLSTVLHSAEAIGKGKVSRPCPCLRVLTLMSHIILMTRQIWIVGSKSYPSTVLIRMPNNNLLLLTLVATILNVWIWTTTLPVEVSELEAIWHRHSSEVWYVWELFGVGCLSGRYRNGLSVRAWYCALDVGICRCLRPGLRVVKLREQLGVWSADRMTSLVDKPCLLGIARGLDCLAPLCRLVDGDSLFAISSSNRF